MAAQHGSRSNLDRPTFNGLDRCRSLHPHVGGYLVEKYTNLRMRITIAAPCRQLRIHTSLCED